MDTTHKLQLCSNLALQGFHIDHRSTTRCEIKSRNILSPHLPIARLYNFVHLFTFSQAFLIKCVKICSLVFPINLYEERKDLVYWWFHVTFTGISCKYVTVHRCASSPKKIDLRSGSQSHAIILHRSLSGAPASNTDTDAFCQSFHD